MEVPNACNFHKRYQRSIRPGCFKLRLLFGITWKVALGGDALIQSSTNPAAPKEDKQVSSADSGKVLQNPQPRRNRMDDDV